MLKVLFPLLVMFAVLLPIQAHAAVDYRRGRLDDKEPGRAGPFRRNVSSFENPTHGDAGTEVTMPTRKSQWENHVYDKAVGIHAMRLARKPPPGMDPDSVKWDKVTDTLSVEIDGVRVTIEPTPEDLINAEKYLLKELTVTPEEKEERRRKFAERLEQYPDVKASLEKFVDERGDEFEVDAEEQGEDENGH